MKLVHQMGFKFIGFDLKRQCKMYLKEEYYLNKLITRYELFVYSNPLFVQLLTNGIETFAVLNPTQEDYTNLFYQVNT